MDYLDFELEVRPLGGRQYELIVIRSPAGETRAEAIFPLDTLQLENSLLKVEVALSRSSHSKRKALTEEEQGVQTFGRHLFDFLFPRPVYSLYQNSLASAKQQDKGLRLKLRLVDPALAHLPWEFLHDKDYLCLAHETPLVRYVELDRTVPPLAVAAPLRVLGVLGADLGPHKLDMAREKARIGRALADLQADGLLEIEWLERPTWRDLTRALRRGAWHIFHFVGHGGFDTYKDEGFLLLADEEGQAKRFYATELGRLLSQHRPLRLALLNACEGAKGGRDLFSSTARILMEKGLPAVLAMQYEISDTAAIEFARTFYETLAEGLPVDRAVSEARLAMSFAFSQTMEWGIPVLAMRAQDGYLFGEVHPTLPASVSSNDFSRPIAPTTSSPIVEATPPLAESEPLDIESQARINLYELLTSSYFSQFDLELLAFQLGMNYENLRYHKLAMTLVQYCEHHGGFATLIALIHRQFPQIEVGELLTVKAASKNEARTTKTVTKNILGIDWVEIPAGEFWMGDDNGHSNEKPCHVVDLPAYWIAKTPITNTQYQQFVQATGHPAPKHWQNGKIPQDKDNHPVVYVSWDDGMALAKWVGEQMGETVLLPSEAEWEKAARGGLVLPNDQQNPLPKRQYPWGDVFDQNNANTNELLIEDTTPVDKHRLGASPYGVLDLSGNVWEWTRSLKLKKPYPYIALDGRENLQHQGSRILRGGSWSYDKYRARVASRDYHHPTARLTNLGFRVVRCVSSPISS